MIDNIDSRRLDELVKQTLSNYEAPTANSDWKKMESMLDAAPKSGAYIYKQKLSFLTDSISQPGILKKVTASYILIAVLMLAGGGYLLYTILKSPKIPENSSNILVTDSIKNITIEEPSVVSNSEMENHGIQPKDSILPPTSEIAKEKAIEKNEITDKKQPVAVEKNDTKTEKAVPEITKVNDKKPENKKEEIKNSDKKEKGKPVVVKKEEKAPQEIQKKTDSSTVVSKFTPLPVSTDSVKRQQPVQQPQQPEQRKDSTKTP